MRIHGLRKELMMTIFYTAVFGLGLFMIFGRSLPLMLWLALLFFIGRRVGRGRI